MDLLCTSTLLLNALLAPISSQPTKLTLDILYAEVKNLNQQYPDVSTVLEIGRSVEDRPIYAVKVQKGVTQDTTVVVGFGIHSRELASTAAGLYFLKKLLTNSACEGLIEQIKWYIIPLMNPDGYKFTVETGQLWRKNRAPLPSSDCVGVDLNRNFPVGWENRTGPDYFCEETYCGESPISQPESIALKKFLDGLKNERIKAYLTVHTCATGIFYPYGWKPEKAANYPELEEVAELMRSSIERVAGTRYTIGPAYLLGVDGGGEDEWVYDTYKIPLVYTFELDNESRMNSRKCFFPSARVTDRLVRECFAGIEALANYLKPDILPPESRKLCFNHTRALAPATEVSLFTVSASIAWGLSSSVFSWNIIYCVQEVNF